MAIQQLSTAIKMIDQNSGKRWQIIVLTIQLNGHFDGHLDQSGIVPFAVLPQNRLSKNRINIMMR